MSKLRSTILTVSTFCSMLLLSGCNMVVLNPKGMIAADEKQLLIDALQLMAIIVVPVIILTFVIARRYRASNTKAKYSPNWAHGTLLEAGWWILPIVIISVLAVMTWRSTHALDPYKPLNVMLDSAGKAVAVPASITPSVTPVANATSNNVPATTPATTQPATTIKPITIEVIALDWRWLFIYPEQNIATLNFLEIPVNTPVTFLITADAPMNSFQIPQLAGQIYAMPGMRTQLNLIADEVGDYDGRSTNFSGDGFANMTFVTRAATQDDFNQWVQSVKQSSNQLTIPAYLQLALPTESNEVGYYSSVADNLFNKVIMKFMMPEPDMQNVNDSATVVNSK